MLRIYSCIGNAGVSIDCLGSWWTLDVIVASACMFCRLRIAVLHNEIKKPNYQSDVGILNFKNYLK